MNYLLDTHVILWWLTEPKKIPAKSRNMISDRNHKIYISSVSFWEMAIKESIGRLTLPKNLIEVLLTDGFILLPLIPEEALGVSDLPFIHQDPFDRMLVVQAKLNNLVFITCDSKISDYPVITLWNK